MWLQSRLSYMSAERQYPTGMHHMTVVPENFEPVADEDDEGDDT